MFLQFPIRVKYSSLTADNLCNYKQNCEKLENLWKPKWCPVLRIKRS